MWQLLPQLHGQQGTAAASCCSSTAFDLPSETVSEQARRTDVCTAVTWWRILFLWPRMRRCGCTDVLMYYCTVVPQVEMQIVMATRASLLGVFATQALLLAFVLKLRMSAALKQQDSKLQAGGCATTLAPNLP